MGGILCYARRWLLRFLLTHYGLLALLAATPGQQFNASLGSVVTNGVPAAGAGVLSEAQEVDVYTLSATAGQKLYFQDLGADPNIDWGLYDAGNQQLFRDRLDGYSPLRIAFTKTGTYQLRVFGAVNTATGKYSFVILDAPDDVFTLPLDGVVTNGVPAVGAGILETPGRVDVYRLNGLPGQQFYFQDLGGDHDLDWALYDSNNQQIFRDRLDGYWPGWVTLTSTNVYELRVLGAGDGHWTGGYSFRVRLANNQVFTLPLDTVVTNATPATQMGHLDEPGEIDVYRFSGPVGQQLYFQDLGADHDIDWGLFDSNNQQIFRDRLDGYWPGWITLTTTNTYELRVLGAGDGHWTGNYSFIVRNSPFEHFNVAFNTVVTNGVPQSGAGTLTIPGQVDIYPIHGAPGQHLYFQDLGADHDIDWGLYDSNNQQIFRDRLDGNFPGWITLATTNTYELRVFGAGDGHWIGNYSFIVRDTPWENFALTFGQVVTNGVPGGGAGSLLVPGSVDIYNFTAVPGQTLYFNDLFADPNIDWGLYDTNNQQIFRDRLDGSSPGRVDFPKAGPYELRVFGAGDGRATGNYSFSVTDISSREFQISVGSIVTNNVPGPGAGILNVPGEQDIFSFEAAAGRTLYFADYGGTSPLVLVLADETGAVLWVEGFGGPSIGNYKLARGGKYRLFARAGGDGKATGTYSFGLLPPAPVITRQPQSLFVVTNRPATLSVFAESDSPIRYQWSRNGTQLPGATNATLTLDAVTPSQTGSYTVALTNTTGVTVSDIARIDLRPLLLESAAARSSLPSVPGNGVSIELFNGIGGGQPPKPEDFLNRVPDGTTLSPVIDFPHPATIINVGNSFDNFFSDTTTPPDLVKSLAAQNFLLRAKFFLRVSRDLDENPATSEIDLQLGAGSDDGFQLTVGTNVLGSAGDRGFTYSWMPVAFESEGLYPVTLLYAANAIGQSGLELSWLTARTNAAEIIPQSALYLASNIGDQLITFEELPNSTVLSNQFLAAGVVFENLRGLPVVTTNSPTRYIPISPTRVFTDPSTSAADIAVTLRFVAGTNAAPALTDFVSFFLLNAQDPGATVIAYDTGGGVLYSNRFHAGGASQELVTVAQPGIASVFIDLGGGSEHAALDNLSFTTPRSGADLAVGILSASPSVLPGGVLSVTWGVTNSGITAVRGPWTEQVFVASSGAPNLPLFALSVSNVLAPGEFITRTQEVTMPFDGPSGTVRIGIQADAYDEISELSENNNAAFAPETTDVPLWLSFATGESNLREGGNPAVLRLTRNGNISAPVTVVLTNDNPSALRIPASISFAAGERSISFDAEPLTDGMIDGTQSAIISALAEGYRGGTTTLLVEDADQPALALSFERSSVTEGGTLRGVVARPLASAEPSTAFIRSSLPARTQLPDEVVIPAGASNATFDVTFFSDGVPNAPRSITFTAEAAGYLSSAPRVVSVTDGDPLSLNFKLSRSSISEGDGANATIATISRAQASAYSLGFEIGASDTDAVSTPSRVFMAAGDTEVSFPIAAIDNAITNAPRTLSIEAAPLDLLRNEPAGVPLSAALIVTDDDGPALSLTFDRRLVGKGLTPAATGSVARRGNSVGALTVALSNDDPASASIPANITIPAGQSSATFSLNSLGGGATGTTKVVRVSASAAGFSSATESIIVTDILQPDLIVTNVSGPATAETESFVGVTYRVVNQGLAPFTTNVLTRLFLSTQPGSGNDLFAGNFSFTGTIPPGDFFEQTLQVRLPTQAGNYWVIATTDLEDAVREVLEDNNTAISAQPIRVHEAYTATATTTTSTAPSGTQIIFQGRAVKAGSNVPAPQVPVHLHLWLRDTHRVLLAVTDDDGNFTIPFTPLPNEAGLYTFGAAHPGTVSPQVQGRFTIVGLKGRAPDEETQLFEGKPLTLMIPIENLSDVALSGLQAQIINSPANVGGDVSLGANLPGSGTVPLSLTLNARDASINRTNVTVRITSVQGAITELVVPVVIESNRPRLVTNPPELLAGMKRGQTTTYDFDLLNTGGEATGPITLLAPELGWLRVVTPSPLPSLAAGASNRVTLQFSPPADLPLGDYKGALVLQTGDSSVSLPFNFRALSELKGDLRISAVDEYTYYAEGAPPVTNATVTVRDAASGVLLTNGVTDASGVFVLPQIFEGYYDVMVSAEQHISYHDTSLVRAGITNDVQAFLSREAVRYLWTVEPTEIEDRTKISIETEFETFVPIPVITIEPAVIDLADITADVTQINLRISNHGLLAANDFKLGFSSHPNWQLEPLVSEFGSLPARSSLTVPLTIRRLRPGQGIRPMNSGVHALAGPCGIWGGGNWNIVCGTKKSYSAPVTVLNAGGDCPPAGGGAWGGNGSVGAPYVVAPYFPIKNDCSTNDCVKLETPEIDASGILKPIAKTVATAANAYLAAQPWNFFLGLKFDVDPEVKGKLGFCCKDNQMKPMISATASGTVKISSSKGNIEKSFPAKFDGFDVGGESGALALDVKVFLGTKAVPSMKLSGTYKIDCEKDKPYWEVTVSGGVDLKSGLEGTAKGTFSVAGKSVKTITGAEVKGGVAGGITFSFSLDSEGKKKVCYKSTGLYAFGSIDVFGKKAELFPGGKYYFIQPEEDCSSFADPFLLRQAEVLAEAEARRILAEQTLTRQSAPADEGGGVCARVRLKLDQDLILTRNAFNATLELLNNDPVDPLRDISIQIGIVDQAGAASTDLFDVSTNQVTGMSSVDGTGVLGTSQKGTASFLIIPGRNAAPEQPTVYKVGGVLTYTQGGRRVVVPLTSVPITVLPDPRLYVKYFHQRDVYSDDPFTGVVEPSVPYSLAVMIQNAGKGEARNVHITSAQPQIVDNEKGLLIDFKIIGTEVSGQPATPSLTVDFGTIPAGDIAIGRWLMTSTLQGLFDKYEATVEHTAGPTDNRSSLLEDLSIHEMTHLVHAPAPFEDGRPDFLVNDETDPEALPDKIYLSNGATNDVVVVRQASVSGALSSNSLSVQISIPTPGDWLYARIADPAQGNFRLRRVVRSDNREIGFGTNVWATDRTFIGHGRKPVRENLIHLFDYKSTGAYTLFYDVIPPPESIAPTSKVQPLPADSYTQIPVKWAGEDNPGGSGIGFYDVYVSIDGGAFAPWIEHTDQTSSVYFAQFGKRYAFYSVATDNVGNREPAHSAADAQTAVTRENHAPTLQPVADLVGDEGDLFLVHPIASDPDGDTLTWSLVGATPQGLQIHPVSGEILWLTGAGLGPSTNRITVQVLDSGIPRLGALRTFNIVLNERNFAPEIQPFSALTIREGQILRLTNLVNDPDWPRQNISFKLAAAPEGATIDPVSGVITWLPNEIQGGSNYLLGVIATDSGTPSLSSTQSLSIHVLDTRSDFAVRLGSTNVMAGASSFLPVFLQSATEITNVTFDLVYPSGRLTNISLQPTIDGITSATLESISSNHFVARITAASPLPASAEVARLVFLADTNESAALTLELSNARATRSNGAPLTNGSAEGAPVFLVRDRAVLGVALVNRVPKLTLYSPIGQSFEVEYRNSLAPNGTWSSLGTVQSTGSFTPLNVPTNMPGPLFFRVRAIDPDSPRLFLTRAPGGDWELSIGGKPATYQLQSRGFQTGAAWQDESSVIVTNGAVKLPMFRRDDAGRLYRALRVP